MATIPFSSKSKILTVDQGNLLIEVLNRSQVTLNIGQWDEIAESLSITNGKAAKERFRYLMKTLNDTSSKTPGKPKVNNVTSQLSTPKTTGKKRAAKGETNKGSGKKAKQLAKDIKPELSPADGESGAREHHNVSLTGKELNTIETDIRTHEIDGLFADMEKDVQQKQQSGPECVGQ